MRFAWMWKSKRVRCYQIFKAVLLYSVDLTHILCVCVFTCVRVCTSNHKYSMCVCVHMCVCVSSKHNCCCILCDLVVFWRTHAHTYAHTRTYTCTHKWRASFYVDVEIEGCEMLLHLPVYGSDCGEHRVRDLFSSYVRYGYRRCSCICLCTAANAVHIEFVICRR